MHFHELKVLLFESNFNEACFQELNCQHVRIGSDDDFAPIKWQVIIWTNDRLDYWHIYVSFSIDTLTLWPLGDFNEILDK